MYVLLYRINVKVLYTHSSRLYKDTEVLITEQMKKETFDISQAVFLSRNELYRVSQDLNHTAFIHSLFPCVLVSPLNSGCEWVSSCTAVPLQGQCYSCNLNCPVCFPFLSFELWRPRGYSKLILKPTKCSYFTAAKSSIFVCTEAITICTGLRAAELKPVVLKGLTR